MDTANCGFLCKKINVCGDVATLCGPTTRFPEQLRLVRRSLPGDGDCVFHASGIRLKAGKSEVHVAGALRHIAWTWTRF